MTPLETPLLLACVAAGLAGFVDAVAGGGGLIQLPALLLLMPGVPVPMVLGTNKGSAIFGTAVATIRYARTVPVPWRTGGAAAAAAFVGSWFGARASSLLNPAMMRPLVLALLVGVAIFTFAKKDFGASGVGRERAVLGVLLGGVIGFYDGFFGPGTGTFLIFLFIWSLGLDFLGASAAAKAVNVATNLAALGSFALAGNVRWGWALPMGAANILGALMGANLAIAKGSAVVRRFFQGVIILLLARLTWDWVRGGGG